MKITLLQRILKTVVFLYLSAIPVWASPNILLVIADDMGLDASPCHSVGSQSANMPTLAGLCENGMVFDNAYTPPSCSPSRAAIMTGKYSFRTGVGSAVSSRRNPVSLSPDETSLFDMFNTKLPNYSTALVGKWHLTSDHSKFDHPAKLGVRNYFGHYYGSLKSYYHWKSVENGKTRKIDGYATTVFTDHAIKWINKQKKPWFLWLAYNAPHVPFHAPPSNLHTYSGIRYGVKPKPQDIKRYYFAALQALDTEMGRLLNSMSAEMRKNTIVIFIGDNGTPNKAVDQVYKARGAKKSLFEGGINVPLIVTGPGVRAGRSKDLVNSTDLFATILHMAGAKSQAPDSIDFSPILQGKTGQRQVAFLEHFSKNKKLKQAVFGWTIRDSRYKLMHQDGVPEMLFDLQNDPFEKTDLLAGSPTDDLLAIQTTLQQQKQAITR